MIEYQQVRHVIGWGAFFRHHGHFHIIPEDGLRSICGHYSIEPHELSNMRFLRTDETRERKRCARCIILTRMKGLDLP